MVPSSLVAGSWLVVELSSLSQHGCFARQVHFDMLSPGSHSSWDPRVSTCFDGQRQPRLNKRSWAQLGPTQQEVT